jgi:serine phosphatase RsbU (regulator of sigma subunit)
VPFFLSIYVVWKFVLIRNAAERQIQEQKLMLETKNKETTDSIKYAKRLQEAILPPLSFIKQYLPDCFVLYKPKDIVAGDFYWCHVLPDEKTVYLAAADCTGHGVPGAMVSVVCSNALNRTVKEFGITEPGKILDKVRELVIETFEKSESEVKDGMDISLLKIKNETEVEWSGANNPLWYVQNKELKELKADKQPIGTYAEQKPFTTHKLLLQKGDSMYVFTDGYADQFGGPKGKKFKYKQLEEKLLTDSHKELEEQKTMLEKTFKNWKGNLEQIDDVLVIGIRV